MLRSNRLTHPLLVLVPLATLMAFDHGPARHPGDLSKSAGLAEFPAHDLFQALQRGDIVRLRRHAWNLFAGLTSQDAFPIKKPIFLSWYTKANLCIPPLEEGSTFGVERPLQFLGLAGPLPVISKVYYNKSAFEFITKMALNDPKQRDTLLSALDNDPLGPVPAERRDIRPFPPDAAALKTMWRVVSADDLTLLPVWDPESNSPQQFGNNPEDASHPASQWPRFVAINPDPARFKGQEYAEGIYNGKVQRARIVPLSRFFYFRIDAHTMGTASASLNGRPARPGDYMIFVGMHVTTKEIPNWVWATFWWHDEPDRGPYAAQRPSSVLAPWRNYLMNVSYDMNEPRETDGAPHIAFNPYLEGPLAGGLKSNCMTCHIQATWKPIQPADTTPGAISPGDRRFADRIRLDFMWTLTDIPDPVCLARN